MNFNTSEEWYNLNMILGHDKNFNILLGAREAGKSFAVMEFCIKQFFKSWNRNTKTFDMPFFWIRLKETQSKAMLRNNARMMVDDILLRKYDLGGKLRTRGAEVYYVDEYNKEHLFATILALSTFYSDKGQALFQDKEIDEKFGKAYNIVLDEYAMERAERNTIGDIGYNFINQLENIIRSRKDYRVFIIGNAVEDASDILLLFNFIPLPGRFGVYKLTRKKAVLHYIPPTKKYLARRKGTAADLLMPDASTFSNAQEMSFHLITKKRPKKLQYIIKFDVGKNTWFSVYENGIIKRYNNEPYRENMIRPMRPLIGGRFYPMEVNLLIENVEQERYKFVNLYTQLEFQKQFKLLRNIK